MIRDGLHLDFETRSQAELKTCGTIRYARHETTQALMLAWAFEDEPVQQWFPSKGPMPSRLKRLLLDPDVIKWAHNYRFERAIFRYVLGIDVPIRQWMDTMIVAFRLSLPGKLGELGDIIKVEGAQKDKRGDKLIQLFSKPRTKSQLAKNPDQIFNDKNSHPKEWEEFCAYNIQDVVAERVIFNTLKKYEYPEIEDEIWYIDEEVNDRGMPVDLDFIHAACDMVKRVRNKYLKRIKSITGVDNPNSTAQLLPWLKERGYPFNNMKRASVEAADRDFDLGEEANEVIELRLCASKSSVDKYQAMLDIQDESHLRHCFQYGGAQRTLRWAGRKPQLQNLPSRFDDVWQENLAEVRQLILEGDEDWIDIMYGDPMDALSACVRTAIVAPEGMELCCADLASIESRGIADLSKCVKMLKVFEDGLDMYKTFAAGLFKIAYEEVSKQQRTFCKPPVLGSGFGLGPGDVTGEYPLEERSGLIRYAHDMGVSMTKEETAKTTAFFRSEYVEVPNAWYALNDAAVKTIQTGRRHRVIARHPITREYNALPLDIWFDKVGPFLRMQLPSGRFIHYLHPRVKVSEAVSQYSGKKYKRYEVSYEGYNPKKKWMRIKTYGGKFIENLVQAWARDILAMGMVRAYKRGFMLLGSVHDELITAVKKGNGEKVVKLLCKMLTDPPDWHHGVPLKAEGFVSPWYRK